MDDQTHNQAPNSQPPEQEMTRSGFLGYLWQEVKQGVVKTVEGEWQKFQKPFQGERKFLRPPGAQTNDHLFMTLCTKCDKCTAACPHGTISVHYGSGFPYDGTPILAAIDEWPCLLCEDLPCINVCPTDALQLPASIAEVRIGKAYIDNTSCVAYRGESCTTCVDVCPFPDSAIALVEGLPHVYDACTGCGICQHHCPTEPKSIVVYPV